MDRAVKLKTCPNHQNHPQLYFAHSSMINFTTDYHLTRIFLEELSILVFIVCSVRSTLIFC